MHTTITERIFQNINLRKIKKRKFIKSQRTYSLKKASTILWNNAIQQIFHDTWKNIDWTNYLQKWWLTDSDIQVLRDRWFIRSYILPTRNNYNRHNFKTLLNNGKYFETSILETRWTWSMKDEGYKSYLIYKIPISKSIDQTIIFDRYFKPNNERKFITAILWSIMFVIVLILSALDGWTSIWSRRLVFWMIIVFIIVAAIIYFSMPNKKNKDISWIETVNNVIWGAHIFSDTFVDHFVERAKWVYQYNQCRILFTQNTVYIVRSLKHVSTDLNMIAITSNKDESINNISHLLDDVKHVKNFCNKVLPNI